MERSKNIKSSRRVSNSKGRTPIAVTLIILFHVVGLAGLSIGYFRPMFLQFVPYHLLLMLLIIIYGHTGRYSKLLLFMLLIFAAGFAAEWVGIHKGWLFGSYTYGNTLGYKVEAVPLIIGVNWILLVYATGAAMQRTNIKNELMRILTGALILVMLDVFIEPEAARFDYWHWTNITVPIKNYICWFLLSAIMLFIFEKFNFKGQRVVGLIFLVTQFVFFIALTLTFS